MPSATETAPLDSTIETFVETKTAGDVAATMAFFSPVLVSYVDATLGWERGGELRILAAVDFTDGKIVCWVGYWHSSSFDDAVYASLRTPGDSFPTDLNDGQVATQAAPELVAVATAVQGAFAAADATAACDLMHTDVLLEDVSLRTQVIGRIEATAYLGRILDAVPYGHSSRLRHVVGGSSGGGFEWTAGPSADSLAGAPA